VGIFPLFIAQIYPSSLQTKNPATAGLDANLHPFFQTDTNDCSVT